MKKLFTLSAFAVVLAGTAFVLHQTRAGNRQLPTAAKDIVQFTSSGHVLGFASNCVYVAGGSHALRVDFINSHSSAPLSVAANNKDDKKKAAPLSQVIYPNLWDGITLTYDAPNGAVARSTYRVEPNARVQNIRLRYNAPVSIQSDGSLRTIFRTGAVNESAPEAWQQRDGKRVPVQVAFVQHGKDEVSFTTGQYDHNAPLFIDPTLTWSTFVGGSGGDTANSVAVDGSGSVYVAGFSSGTWASPVIPFSGGTEDAFVAKLDSNGNLVWNTFLGGSGDDEGYGVAVDGTGSVYCAGYSDATWGSPVSAFSGVEDAFAAKLDTNGNLIWSTFLGGSGTDEGFSVAVATDGSGHVYIAGTSTITWGSPVQAFGGGPEDAFAAELDSAGNRIWNTFLGGSGDDEGYGVAVDGTGNVYVAGTSHASWGSPVRAFSGGIDDAFAAKLDANGNLTWNTFLGGTGNDEGSGVAVDGSGNVYVTGFSTASWGHRLPPSVPPEMPLPRNSMQMEI